MKTFISSFLIAGFITLSGCQKNQPDINAEQDINNLNSFIEKYGPKPENFTVNAASGATLTTSSGTKIFIKPNAFITASGVTVTGTVDIGYTELKKPSDMILANKPTITNDGGLLISAGEFYLTATQNGQNLQNTDAVSNAIFVRLDAPENVDASIVTIDSSLYEWVPLWIGNNTQEVTNTLNGLDYNGDDATQLLSTVFTFPMFTWNLVLKKGEVGSPLVNTNEFSISCPEVQPFKWNNCDVLWNYPAPKIRLMCYFNSGFNNGFEHGNLSAVAFKIKDLNILTSMPFRILNPIPGKAGYYSYDQIPVGIEGTLLGYSFLNGKLYADTLTIKVSSPAPGKNFVPVTIHPKEVSETQLNSMITSMNSR